MTSGAAMMAVGVYLMLFGNDVEVQIIHFGGLILATIGYIITARSEDDYNDRLQKLEKNEVTEWQNTITKK